jgi:hypothetical protein
MAGNYCASVALAESIFKAFWSLVVLKKGRRGSWWTDLLLGVILLGIVVRNYLMRTKDENEMAS